MSVRRSMALAALAAVCTLSARSAAQPVAGRLAAPPAESAVVGSADPAPAAGGTGIDVRPGLEVFAQYALRLTNTDGGTEWFHVFEVPRAHASLAADYETAHARLVVEAVRSASEGALLGVAGDSLVLRLREAWAGWSPADFVALRAGVVPTLTIPELEGTFRMRAVSPSGLEATGLASPADLGASARVSLPRRYGWLGVAAYDGEGYTSRELNRGKTLELAGAVHPLPRGALLGLGAFVSYVVGSTGTGRVRADRATAGLLWQGRIVRGGVAATYAWGVGEAGGRRSVLVDAFVHSEPIDRLLLGVRGGVWQRDTSVSTDRVTTLTAAAGWRVVRPLEAYLAMTRSVPESAAADALPGAKFWDFRLVSRVAF